MNKLGEVMLEVSEEWFADLPAPEEVPAYTYSKKYLKWEQEAIYGKKHVTLKRVAKVLLVAAILIIMLAVIALSTTKGREFILNFFNDSAVYNINAENSPLVKSFDVKYLPKGFKLVDSYQESMVIYCEYKNENQYLTICKSPNKSSTDFDYNGNEKQITINSITYVISITEPGYCNVIWNYNNYTYRITGSVPENEALKIAQNVR